MNLYVIIYVTYYKNKNFKKIDYKQILTIIPLSAIFFFSYNNLVGQMTLYPNLFQQCYKIKLTLIKYSYTMSLKVRGNVDANLRKTFIFLT